jgi:short-subunit dehydrogenase
MTHSRKVALVTGASAGIGKAFALELAQRDFDVVLTARRRDRLEAVASELRAASSVRVEIIAGDLADPETPGRLIAEIGARGLSVDVLVNNAGYGIPVRFSQTTWKQQADFQQVLVTSVAHLTHLCVPPMLERGYGRVVNIASLAGLVPGAPGSTLYGAAKGFLIKMSESLAAELHGTGVTATAVCPGFTYSEFHDVNQTRERVSRMPAAMWMDAQTVAREGLDGALAGQVVVVSGALNRAIATTMKHLPDALGRRILRGQARRFRHLE